MYSFEGRVVNNSKVYSSGKKNEEEQQMLAWRNPSQLGWAKGQLKLEYYQILDFKKDFVRVILQRVKPSTTSKFIHLERRRIVEAGWAGSNTFWQGETNEQGENGVLTTCYFCFYSKYRASNLQNEPLKYFLSILIMY